MKKEKILKISTEILTAYINTGKIPYINSVDVLNYPNTLLNETNLKVIENQIKLSVSMAKMLYEEVDKNLPIEIENFNHYIEAKNNFTELLNCNHLEEMTNTLNDFLSHIPINIRYDYLKYMKELIYNMKLNNVDEYLHHKVKVDKLNDTINKFISIYK